MVTRLDRLARSTRDLLNTLAAITGRKAGFKSLGDAWADTTTAHGRLMLAVLGGLAEFERDLIRARTGEGRERAKERAVKMGRKPKLTPPDTRGDQAPRPRGRDSARDCPDLQCFSLDNFTASGMKCDCLELLISCLSVYKRSSSGLIKLTGPRPRASPRGSADAEKGWSVCDLNPDLH